MGVCRKLRAILVLTCWVIACFLVTSGSCATPSCRDENGDVVSFFVVYKRSNSSEYYVLYPGRSLQYGGYDLTKAESVFGRTLQPTYESGQSDVTCAVWNDQRDESECEVDDDEDPELLSAANGHTKGILAFNNGGGFVMLHSVPRFGGGSSYTFPASGERYAQTAICLNLDSQNPIREQQIVDILERLRFFKPLVTKTHFAPNLDAGLREKIETLGDYLQRPVNPTVEHLTLTPTFNAHFFGRHIKPSNPLDMTHDAFNTLAKRYNTNLYTQSWSHCSNSWPSSCPTNSPTVENVQTIKVGVYSWTTNQDHSKWAVSASLDLACIGDLNRHSTTMSRGGWFICTNEQFVVNAFRSFPVDFETCT